MTFDTAICVEDSSEESAFTEKDVEEMYKKKYEFLRKKLRLDKKSAEEWALDSREVFREGLLGIKAR